MWPFKDRSRLVNGKPSNDFMLHVTNCLLHKKQLSQTDLLAYLIYRLAQGHPGFFIPTHCGVLGELFALLKKTQQPNFETLLPGISLLNRQFIRL